MARTRTTKKLAQRIDLNYFKRPTPLKRAKFWFSLLLPLLAIIWISWHAFTRDARLYSSGRMSEPHAILEKECASCHVQKAAFFSAKPENQACLSCHDGPIHHTSPTNTPDCATCHTEHRGRVNIAAVGDKSCAQCHADLRTAGTPSPYSGHIHSFAEGHPEFAALRKNQRDLSTIKLNHSIHMRPIRRGPAGPIVQLDCADCHRPAAVKTLWTYADANYLHSTTASVETLNIHARNTDMPTPHAPPTGREFMAPVTFANSCASCHLLSFDKRFNKGVPHDTPQAIHTFLNKQFQDYVAAHPSELRMVREPDRDLAGKPLTPRVRTITAASWVADRTFDAEQLLWRKTCLQCHQFSVNGSGQLSQVQTDNSRDNVAMPRVVNANVTTRWMPHAKFNHEAHGSFTCVSCHEKALSSVDSSDLLLPGIKICQTCHAPGPDRAESRCFECHTYHDWSKRKEITPKFSLPPLQSSGR